MIEACKEPAPPSSDSDPESAELEPLQLRTQMLSRPMSLLASAEEQLRTHPELAAEFHVRTPKADRSANSRNNVQLLIEELEGLSDSESHIKFTSTNQPA